MFLVVGSFFVLKFVINSVDKRRERELEQLVGQIVQETNEIVVSAVDTLYDLRGFILTSDINSDRWSRFITVNDLERRFPNIYSLAYVERVEKGDLKNYEETLRKTEGERYKNYSVFPVTEGPELFPIKYLHSADPDVATLLGFNFIYSERSVEAFMEAVIKDQPTMSELTHLNIVIPESKKTGYEVIVPVYSVPSINDYPLSDRRNYLMGFVGAWIATGSLTPADINLSGVRYSLFDKGERVLLSGTVDEDNIRSTVSREIQILNRKFDVVLETDRRFGLSSFEENIPLMTFLAILLILILWFITIFSTLSARAQAIELADLATRDLKKFKQAVDGVSDQVVIADPHGIIVYANKAAENITGYKVVEMIGKKTALWRGVVPREIEEKFWRTVKQEKLPYSAEFVNKRKNGETYESESRVSPILDKNGNLIYLVEIEHDLSKMRSIEKIKSEFISLASHQLRTPLSGVKWFVEMMLSGDSGRLSSLQKKYLTKIKESNDREIQLVNSLLNVSRIESGKIVVTSKKTNLKKFVEGVVSEVKANIAGDNEISLDIQKDLPEVMIDPDLIKHVYSNLISNAAVYSKPGGKIEVRVYSKGGVVTSEVKDEGIGIPKAEQPRMFEKFFRASNATKKVTEGTGLGLYLSKTIIESSGGKIWYESVEGKGSSFKFSLPIEKSSGSK